MFQIAIAVDLIVYLKSHNQMPIPNMISLNLSLDFFTAQMAV